MNRGAFQFERTGFEKASIPTATTKTKSAVSADWPLRRLASAAVAYVPSIKRMCWRSRCCGERSWSLCGPSFQTYPCLTCMSTTRRCSLCENPSSSTSSSRGIFSGIYCQTPPRCSPAPSACCPRLRLTQAQPACMSLCMVQRPTLRARIKPIRWQRFCLPQC